MRAFIHLFHKRKQEVNLYFEHLEDLSDKNAQLIFSDGALKTVDAVAIKDISRKYGFSIRTEAEKTKNGEKLATVKKRRNHLAHGFMSFKECGQERPIEMVRAIKEESLLYIEQILNNIEQFLEDKKYLKS
jgi:hypothetical protein